MKPAIIAIDMFEDAFSEKHNPVTLFARAIVPGINRLTDIARHKDIPITLSMDIFPYTVQRLGIHRKYAVGTLVTHCG